MRSLIATFRIVTPMFISGADQKKAQLRIPSIKGALRFWWRALNWSRILAEAQDDEPSALRSLHREESQLFGTAVRPQRQSPCHFRFLQRPVAKKVANVLDQPKAGQAYLLGQGLYRNGEYLRSECIPAGSDIEVRCDFRPEVEDGDIRIRQIAEALIALGLFGGLGSRARRGLGSISLLAIESRDIASFPSVTVPHNMEAYIDTIKRLLGRLSIRCPPFTAFSRETSLDVSDCFQKTSGWNALDGVGRALHDYRSYRGHPLFGNDHNQILALVQGRSCPSSPPRRCVFGLPHNYFYSSEFRRLVVQGRPRPVARKEASATIQVSQRDRTRRASPLFIHIHRFPDGSIAVVQILMRAQFLPAGAGLKMSSPRYGRLCKKSFSEAWRVVTDYLDGFQNRKTILP